VERGGLVGGEGDEDDRQSPPMPPIAATRSLGGGGDERRQSGAQQQQHRREPGRKGRFAVEPDSSPEPVAVEVEELVAEDRQASEGDEAEDGDDEGAGDQVWREPEHEGGWIRGFAGVLAGRIVGVLIWTEPRSAPASESFHILPYWSSTSAKTTPGSSDPADPTSRRWLDSGRLTDGVRLPRVGCLTAAPGRHDGRC
jgi:hypothetical protein